MLHTHCMDASCGTKKAEIYLKYWSGYNILKSILSFVKIQ